MTRREPQRHAHTLGALTLSALLTLSGASLTLTPLPAGASGAKLSGSITVSAASSLTEVFTQLGQQFQVAHPGTKIAFNFGSSSTLATQIQQGAPADVFASASIKSMGLALHAGDIVGSATLFASNTLAIVVKPGNPLHIHSLSDLNKAKVVAICVSSAPCGEAARKALAKAHIFIATSRITLGQDVKSTLAAVSRGDANAAIVYVTDARTVAHTDPTVAIVNSQNIVTSYPIALVKGAKNTTLARAWIAYVLGPTGQRALHGAGFLAPR